MRKLAAFVTSAALLALASGSAAWSQSVPERLDRLEKELAALKKTLASKPASAPGARGDAGPAGPAGPRGERGPAGPLEFPLHLETADAKPLIWLGRGSNAAGILNLSNSRGTASTMLSAGEPTAGGNATFSDAYGKMRAFVGTGTDATGILVLFGGDGKRLVELSSAGQDRGQIFVNGEKVQDYAEVMEVATREGVTPGTVMAVAGPAGRVGLSSAPYDRRVVGVVSGAGGLQPGSVIGSREDGTNDLPVAVSGQVYVRVSLEGGTIEPGDLLVASSRPGVAMRAADANRAHGAVVGKALESFGAGPAGEGLVRMMVMLR